MKKIKVVTVLGTRPEIIRLSRVMALLDEYTEHIVVHTGQNYDYELSQVFFDELEIRKPDVFLDVPTSTLGSTLGNILISIEKVFIEIQPDAVLILGDTNSSISGIIAKRFKIPLYHMEAGNRSFDPNVPEEVNRKIIDRISDFNLVYTEHARRHLISEGFPHRRIYLTGSPMKEVLDFYKEKIVASSVLDRMELSNGGYFLASIHREENVDSKENLESLLDALIAVRDKYSKKVLISTHPRTRKRLENLSRSYEHEGLQFAQPFGFLDYNNLQMHAFCVLSDSGTITEESALLGFPAVTVRKSMERPEGLDTGSIVLAGLDPQIILNAVDVVTRDWENGKLAPVPDYYQIENVSQRVLRLVVGTAKLSNQWDGLLRHDYDK